MCLGDTRQPELCFMVCLFARRLGQPDEVDRRLSAHMALAAMDLGLEPERIDEWLDEWIDAQLADTDTPRFLAGRVLRACEEHLARWSSA
jgi:hypothetical protein